MISLHSLRKTKSSKEKTKSKFFAAKSLKNKQDTWSTFAVVNGLGWRKIGENTSDEIQELHSLLSKQIWKEFQKFDRWMVTLITKWNDDLVEEESDIDHYLSFSQGVNLIVKNASKW